MRAVEGKGNHHELLRGPAWLVRLAEGFRCVYFPIPKVLSVAYRKATASMKV